jgi:glucose/arabinose dehydrogenase
MRKLLRANIPLILALAALLLLVQCGGAASRAPTVQTPVNPAPPTATPAAPAPSQVTLAAVVSGLNSPVDLQQPRDNSGRLFVVEQSGTIRIIQNGALLSFLDIRSKVDFGGEKGLLGLAFHPNYAQNRRFFLHYDRVVGGTRQSVIAEYLTSTADANQADTNSERILLTVDQPFDNHKGGQMAFGPDGFLYVGLGDGGSGNDPLGNGQNLQTLLGKLLRIDVDASTPGKQYRIPADNPFASGGGLPEIWAFGLRNPWRFSFDNGTGRLFCADVGESQFEEIDLIQRGGNYGWNIMEGAHCLSGAACNMNGLALPIAEYDHTEGNAVMGGYVYRGTTLPQLLGAYIFGDFGSGKIWELREDPSGIWTRVLLLSTGKNISSFGQDQAGEIYVVEYGGSVLKLAP